MVKSSFWKIGAIIRVANIRFLFLRNGVNGFRMVCLKVESKFERIYESL